MNTTTQSPVLNHRDPNDESSQDLSEQRGDDSPADTEGTTGESSTDGGEEPDGDDRHVLSNN